MTTPRLIGDSKNEPIKSTQKRVTKKNTEGKLAAIVFLVVCTGLITGVYFYFSSYKPTPVAERFYTDRKALSAPQKQSKESKAKRNSEKNIFLQ